MPSDRRRTRDEDEDEPKETWKDLVRDLLVAGVIVAVVLGAMYAYAGVWPPLVVVESSSMQHANDESFFGVIDTGDMVFQQTASTRASVITYLEGRASGYSTYGDFGDVVIFQRPQSTTPVIHRPIMYITLHAGGTADVPDLTLLPSSEWQATNGSGPTTNPYGLRSVTIHQMGFQHDLGITFDFLDLSVFAPRSGYVTMGDHNAYLACAQNRDPCRASTPYDTGWLPRQSDIIGRARGEFPWFGLLKLTLSPTDSCCASGWGDPEAPKNSWDSLLVSLIFLFALPFILEYAGRAWGKYVSPRLPEIRWPWRRKATSEKGDAREANDPKRGRKKPPREESSEP